MVKSEVVKVCSPENEDAVFEHHWQSYLYELRKVNLASVCYIGCASVFVT